MEKDIIKKQRNRTLEEPFLAMHREITGKSPLIHCITSPIAINDCANAVLAVGAKPIMAEHPAEVAGITGMAGALSVSLANITDARRESILISGKKAREKGIRSVIDVVGVTCSHFRMELANRFIRDCRPAVIKGNSSEIRALAGCAFDAVGIDAGQKDELIRENELVLEDTAAIVKEYSQKTKAVVLATGAVDILSDGEKIYLLENGSEWMAKVTGTGCVLSCLIAVYLSSRNAPAAEAAMLAATVWGIAGELADHENGLGSYHVGLLDELSGMTDEAIAERMRISGINKA